MFSNVDIFKEEFLLEQADEANRKLLISKLKGLNDHLSNLVQKQLRLELEIKRTKKKLSRLKNDSQTYVKAKIQLEGFNQFPLSQEQTRMLSEKVGYETFKEIIQLDQLIDEATDLNQEIEKLLNLPDSET